MCSWWHKSNWKKIKVLCFEDFCWVLVCLFIGLGVWLTWSWTAFQLIQRCKPTQVAKLQKLFSATTQMGDKWGQWEEHCVVVLGKQVPEKISPCSMRTKMKLCQNFTQSHVGNELQIPEMGKIPFLSRHTALSSINKHMIAVTKANLVVTQGPLAHAWVFSLDLRVSSLLWPMYIS